ncbi:cytochrome P450 [Mycena crocata]|nr:cytochrome P450 [Mycena crocata]
MALEFFRAKTSGTWYGVKATDVIAVSLFLVFLIYAVLGRRPKGKLPPSPPGGLPLLGNVLQMPKKNGWLLMHEWSKTLGPIFHLNMAGQPLIVLNSNEAELLERRSHIYSDCPRMIMTNELMSRGLVVGFSRFGDQDPASWDDHLQRVIASSLFTALYGGEPMLNKNDPIVKQINDCMHRLTGAAVPGAFLVDVFPIMKNIPEWVAKWKRDAINWYHTDSKMFNGWLDRVRKDMKSENPPPSFGGVLLEGQQQFQLEDEETPWLAGSMFYFEGLITPAVVLVQMLCTAGITRWFMLAATLYPEKVKKVQDELDLVVGRSRLPTFDDRESLPYMCAFCRKVMRWRTVAPMGVPHRLMEVVVLKFIRIPRTNLHYFVKDDAYMGYFLLKGSILISNIYSINRSVEAFSDAELFTPERFLNDNSKYSSYVACFPLTFWNHRRACAGMHIANNLLFINVANILWSFNIVRAKDANGNEIVPSATNYHDTELIVRPHLWKVDIVPRGPEPLKIAKDRFSRGVN